MNAVHAMEHGAVWVTYAPDLPAADLDAQHPMDMTSSASTAVDDGTASEPTMKPRCGRVHDRPRHESDLPDMNEDINNTSYEDDRGSSKSRPATMPGMATLEEIQRLTAPRCVAAEQLFLMLMVKHHRGITMAQAVLNPSDDPDVRLLAQTMVTGQTAEIAAMQAMLDERVTPGEDRP